jgi:uncharacterized protein YndB with AHSA1/START domain
MTDQSFTATFVVDQPPSAAFAAITDPRAWWSAEIEGVTDALGAEFTYRYRDVHRATMKITELVPDERVVWLCLDNYFSFIDDKTEWIGTEIVFEIGEQGDRTRVSFTHVGLVPDYECFDACTTAWGGYVTDSLKTLITTGVGNPNNDVRNAEAAAAALGQRAEGALA